MGYVILSPQHGENADFSYFPLMFYGCGTLLVIPLDFREGKHHPVPMAQPFVFALAVVLPNP